MQKNSHPKKEAAKDSKINNNTALPEGIEERAELVLNSNLSPQKTRLLSYILNHPNSWTHTIAQACAVGFPPNCIGELNKDVLPRFGLHILCFQPKTKLQNRYGEKSQVHKWKLILLGKDKLADTEMTSLSQAESPATTNASNEPSKKLAGLRAAEGQAKNKGVAA